MMTTVAVTASFDLAEVPQSTFGVLSRNLPNFFILAVVLIGVPSLAFHWLNATLPTDPAGLITRSLLGVAWAIVAIMLSFLLQAALVAGTISDLNGRRIGVGEMISGRLSLVPTLLGLAIIQALAEGIGFVLLIVPGVILATIWAVTVPAAVIEKTGVFGAFSRSGDLTRGHRWSVFGLIFVYFIALMIVNLVATALLGGFRGLAAGAAGAAAFANSTNIGLIAFEVVLGVFTNMVGATGIAVIYFELRRVREGVAPQALVDTFS
jgi:hypothetical protein